MQGVAEFALSPDKRFVAISAIESANQDLWVWDIARAVRTRLVSAPERDFAPVWSPGGQELAFSSDRAGNSDIFLVDTDGSEEEKVLIATPLPERVTDWSRDGNHILYQVSHPETQSDIWYLERKEHSGSWESRPFVQTPSNQREAKFSPDGRFVAYLSDDSGRLEAYVRTFPKGDRKWTVSNNGATGPRWSQNGRELFCVEGRALAFVSVLAGPAFSVGPPAPLFTAPLSGQPYARYDVSADGRQFLVAERLGPGTETAEPSVRVVQNWYEEFRGREQD